MCNLSFSYFTETESRRVRNVWMLQDRVRKKARQSFFIHARVMITSAGSLMITKSRGSRAENAWAQIALLSEKATLLYWPIAILVVPWNLPSGSRTPL